MTLSQDNLFNYFNLNFSLMTHYKYTLADIENMIPWEREVYVTILADYVKKQKEKLSIEQQNLKHEQ